MKTSLTRERWGGGCKLTGHEPLSTVVGELNGVDTAKMSEHILLVEAGAACQSPSLKFFLHERLASQLSAGQKAHRGAHTAALELLHFHRARREKGNNTAPALALFSPPRHLFVSLGRCGPALSGLHYGG